MQAAIRPEIMGNAGVVCAEIVEEVDVIRAEQIAVEFDVHAKIVEIARAGGED